MSWMGLVFLRGGTRFLVQHEEFINELDGACPFPRAARGNSEMSWMGLVSPMIYEEMQKLVGWGLFFYEEGSVSSCSTWKFRKELDGACPAEELRASGDKTCKGGFTTNAEPTVQNQLLHLQTSHNEPSRKP